MSLSNNGCFKIGSTEFAPKSLNITYDSLASENSGRTDDGVMHINFIKKYIPKVEITMPPCTSTEASTILGLVQGKIYNLTFYDLRSGSEVTRECYTSTSKGECYSGIYNNNTGLWESISFNAIGTANWNEES